SRMSTEVERSLMTCRDRQRGDAAQCSSLRVQRAGQCPAGRAGRDRTTAENSQARRLPKGPPEPEHSARGGSMSGRKAREQRRAIREVEEMLDSAVDVAIFEEIQ